MRCSEFRDLHCSYVDDTLAGVELVRMQRHLAECGECAALDTRVRRALMMVHNLTPIQPSADFGSRLAKRLRECREHEERTGANFRTVAAVGAVASLMMLGYVAESLQTTNAKGRDIILPPVVALAIPPAADSSPASPASPAPVILASMSAGMPIWPAALLAEQAPLQLVSYTQAR